MTSKVGENPGQILRKRRYVDHRLQGALLIALIAMEVCMIAIAMVYLYFRFNIIIEDSLYRIHQVGTLPTHSLLVELVQVMGIFTVINVCALFVAHIIWVHYVQNVVKAFRRGLGLMAVLDFRKTDTNDHAHHEVLDLLHHWQRAERERSINIRNYCKQLPDLLIERNQATSASELLDKVRNLLILGPQEKPNNSQL